MEDRIAYTHKLEKKGGGGTRLCVNTSEGLNGGGFTSSKTLRLAEAFTGPIGQAPTRPAEEA